MNKPMVRIHNSETGEIIDREMNAAELKQHEIDLAAFAKANADAEAAVAAKAAILNRLGITADEAALLLQ
jgi:hypothetical protein